MLMGESIVLLCVPLFIVEHVSMLVGLTKPPWKAFSFDEFHK